MSKTGLVLAGLYIAISAWLIATQGLFGESFIALILGLPWVLVLALFELGGASGAVAAVLVLTPIAINVVALYFIGWLIGRTFSR